MALENPHKENNGFFDTQLKSYVAFERELADVVTRVLIRALGSLGFLIGSIAFILVWVGINLGWVPGVRPFDPYPFTLLLMLIAFFAMLLAIVVLINQNRQGRMADVRQRIDFEINVRAEHEITKILKMLDELSTNLGMQKPDTELEQMEERIDITEIKEDIEEGLKKE